MQMAANATFYDVYEEDSDLEDAIKSGSLKLSEVGLYSYASLCGQCLGRLYWDDNIQTDR